MGSLPDWICALQCDHGPCVSPSSAMLLIVLFIVRLCWLMARCYVRRTERLPQARAGRTVNPSKQPYWLTENWGQCHCNLHMPTFKDSLPTANCKNIHTCYVCVARVARPWSHWAAIIFRVCLACAQRAIHVGFIPLGESRQTVFLSLFSKFSLFPFFEQPLYTQSVGYVARFRLCLHFILARRDFSLNHS